MAEHTITMRNRAFQFLDKHYKPAYTMGDGVVRFASLELFEKLQLEFPSADYNQVDIIEYLHEKKYAYVEIRPLTLEWLMIRTE